MVKIVKQFATEDKFHFKLEEKYNLTTTTISLMIFYVGIFQNKRKAERSEANPINVLLLTICPVFIN